MGTAPKFKWVQHPRSLPSFKKNIKIIFLIKETTFAPTFFKLVGLRSFTWKEIAEKFRQFSWKIKRLEAKNN